MTDLLTPVAEEKPQTLSPEDTFKALLIIKDEIRDLYRTIGRTIETFATQIVVLESVLTEHVKQYPLRETQTEAAPRDTRRDGAYL